MLSVSTWVSAGYGTKRTSSIPILFLQFQYYIASFTVLLQHTHTHTTPTEKTQDLSRGIHASVPSPQSIRPETHDYSSHESSKHWRYISNFPSLELLLSLFSSSTKIANPLLLSASALHWMQCKHDLRSISNHLRLKVSLKQNTGVCFLSASAAWSLLLRVSLGTAKPTMVSGPAVDCTLVTRYRGRSTAKT